jgi:hypothetical protein
MAKLSIQAEQLIEIAYLDLLAAKNHTYPPATRQYLAKN